MKTLSLLLFLSMFCVAGYGFFVEPNHVQVRQVEVQNFRLSKLLNDKKLVFLSDLHIGDTFSDVASQSLRILSRIKPDIIFLAGDFVQWGGSDEAYENAFRFLANLEAPLGVFAVLGDSDRSNSRKSCEFCHQKGLSSATERHNVTFLRDESVPVRIENEVFYVGTGRGGKNKSLTQPAPLIVLNHSSLFFESLPKENPLLFLAGDSHGGQILLPDLFWEKSKRKPDPEHMYGLFKEGKKALYVTSGIGTTAVHFRLGMPPEIVLFHFTE